MRYIPKFISSVFEEHWTVSETYEEHSNSNNSNLQCWLHEFNMLFTLLFYPQIRGDVNNPYQFMLNASRLDTPVTSTDVALIINFLPHSM